MKKKFKRNIFFNVNEFQDRILLPFYLSCLIALVCVLIVVSLANPLLPGPSNLKEILGRAFNPETLPQLVLIVCVIASVLVLIYWAYFLSNKTLGAYYRVLDQLDGVILGKKRGPITVRQGDKLFEGILERVNILIEKDTEARDKKIERLLKKRLSNTDSARQYETRVLKIGKRDWSAIKSDPNKDRALSNIFNVLLVLFGLLFLVPVFYLIFLYVSGSVHSGQLISGHAYGDSVCPTDTIGKVLATSIVMATVGTFLIRSGVKKLKINRNIFQ